MLFDLMLYLTGINLMLIFCLLAILFDALNNKAVIDNINYPINACFNRQWHYFRSASHVVFITLTSLILLVVFTEYIYFDDKMFRITVIFYAIFYPLIYPFIRWIFFDSILNKLRELPDNYKNPTPRWKKIFLTLLVFLIFQSTWILYYLNII